MQEDTLTEGHIQPAQNKHIHTVRYIQKDKQAVIDTEGDTFKQTLTNACY